MDGKLVGALTISRDSSDTIRITITDRASGVRFAELRMTPADFALAVTGQAYIDGELTVCDLENVGKKKVIESREILCPLTSLDKSALQEWLAENAQEDGWIVNPYLGSQGSVTRRGSETILNYSVKKYVPIAALTEEAK